MVAHKDYNNASTLFLFMNKNMQTIIKHWKRRIAITHDIFAHD